jgi:DNA polymerase-3 subunit alpha
LTATTNINDLIKKATEEKFSAVGLVDIGNMMGAFKFVSAVESANSDIAKKYKEYLSKNRKLKKREKRSMKQNRIMTN